MQFCIENLDQAGGCTYNYSCAYTDSISWASPNEPLPMIRDPRVAFDMLFGAGTTSAEPGRARQTAAASSIGSSARSPACAASSAPPTAVRLDQYLENVREIERRIQAIEAANTSGEPRELPDAPAGVPDSFTEHIKLMFDLQVLALETDMTRVISFKTGRDAQNRVFPESGSNQPFHPASHHGNREDRILEFNKICKYRVSQLPLLPRQAEEHDGRRARTCSTRRWSCGARRWPTPTCTTIAAARWCCSATATACSRATCTSRPPTRRRWPTSC